VVRIVDCGVVWHAHIIEPEKGRPARKIVTGRRRRVTGFAPSRKACSDGLVPWESELERDCIAVAEFQQDVESIVAQPHTLEVTSDFSAFQHTPDFLFEVSSTASGQQVVEVKPDGLALEPETERRLRISAKAHCALGFAFQVLGEGAIRAEPRLANAQLLLRYRLAAVRRGLAHRLSTLSAKADGRLSIGACVRALDGNPTTRFELYSLACRGLLELDLSTPLGSATIIRGCRVAAEPSAP
jgi:hypothetical protein